MAASSGGLAPGGARKPADLSPDAQTGMRRVSMIVLPLMGASCLMMTLDRGNLAFAATQMNPDLKIDAGSYGFAAGIFYLTYALLQVPSAAIGLRVGMRWWFGFITIAWGVVATLTCLINNATQLYVMRLLLGAFEAGAAPCAYHILAAYYPYDRLSKPYSVIFLGNQVASIISAPLGAALLKLNGVNGWAGWRYLFLVEGLPSVALGFVLLAFMPTDPLTAWWLRPAEREALHLAVHAGGAEEARTPPSLRKMWAMLVETVRIPLVWVVVVAGFLWVMCAFSLYAFIPMLVSNLINGTALTSATSAGGGKATSVRAVLLSTVPYVVAAIAVVGAAWHSDKVGERTAHVAVPWFLSGVVLALWGPVTRASAVGGFIMITAAMGLAYAGQSILVTRAAGIVPPANAAISLGIMNAVAAGLGGFVGPVIVGAVVQSLRSFESAALAMSSFILVSSLIVVGIYIWERRTGHTGGVAAGPAAKDAPSAANGAAGGAPSAAAGGGWLEAGAAGGGKGGALPLRAATFSTIAAAVAATPAAAAAAGGTAHVGDLELGPRGTA